MSNFVWFGYGLIAVCIVGFGLFNIVKQKFITLNEAMILFVLFLAGPAGFVISLVAAVGRIMIEVNSKPNTPILDWRVASRPVECPKCAWSSDAHPTGANSCPNCYERLLNT